jgi:hypothetical protein
MARAAGTRAQTSIRKHRTSPRELHLPLNLPLTLIFPEGTCRTQTSARKPVWSPTEDRLISSGVAISASELLLQLIYGLQRWGPRGPVQRFPRCRVHRGGIRILASPPQAPRANAICERFIGTLRRKLLGRLLIVNKHHLRQVLAEYLRHYNTARPHRALCQLTSAQADTSPPGPVNLAEHRIRRKQVLGGLPHEYHVAALLPTGDPNRFSEPHRVGAWQLRSGRAYASGLKSQPL